MNTPHTSEPKGEWAERPYMEVERAARDCIDPRYSRDQTSRVTRTRVKRARGATALASAEPRGVVNTRLSDRTDIRGELRTRGTGSVEAS